MYIYSKKYIPASIIITLHFVRFQTYTNQTMPIIERYEKKGMVKKISGLPSPEEVYYYAVLAIIQPVCVMLSLCPIQQVFEDVKKAFTGL